MSLPGSGVPLGAKNLGARNQGRTGDKVVAPVGAWGGMVSLKTGRMKLNVSLQLSHTHIKLIR